MIATTTTTATVASPIRTVRRFIRRLLRKRRSRGAPLPGAGSVSGERRREVLLEVDVGIIGDAYFDLEIVPPSHGKNGVYCSLTASYASRPDAGLAVLIATRLPADMAARRSDRGPDRLGGADSRGAGVRDDRWSLPGRRALRGAGALLLYAAFGSSRHLITGPMSATAALSAATVSSYATAGSSAFVTMTAALAISAGLAALIAGLLRLGFLASFISEPVLKGFIVGLALTIIVGQLPALFGVEKGSGDFFQKLWDLISKLGQTQWLTLVVGLASLALILILRRVAPASPDRSSR